MTNGGRPNRQTRYADRMPKLDLRPLRTLLLSLLAAAAWVSASVARDVPARPPTPSELFGDLYARVEAEHLFPDSKTFADAVPLKSPEAILSDYRAQAPSEKATLTAFVHAH